MKHSCTIEKHVQHVEKLDDEKLNNLIVLISTCALSTIIADGFQSSMIV